MTNKRSVTLVQAILPALLLVAIDAGAGAYAAICKYTEAGGSGIGGTGIVAKGTGIGGTGLLPDFGSGKTQVVGTVLESKGVVEARRNGSSRRLAKNDPVCLGETVATQESGAARIKMADEGLVEIRPKSTIKIETFIYEGANKKTTIALLNGSSRFVTGNIGKAHPENVLVKTQSAVIGVHGTDHEVTVILPDGKGANPPGTYDKVNYGVTFIRTAKGEIDVHPTEVGYAAGTGTAPVLLHEIPDFLRAEIHKAGDQGNPEAALDSVQQDSMPNQDDQEHPDTLDGVAPAFEGHDIGEIPHAPEFFDPPEMPDAPEKPDLPDLPEEPDVPDVPVAPDS